MPLSMTETGPGEFDLSVVGTQSGAYLFHMQASGNASRGYPFTREFLLSGVLGRAPVQPSDPTRGPVGLICELFECLFEHGVIRPELLKRLEGMEIDVERLQRCLKLICRRSRIR
jgi:hypothetical protein